MADSGGILRRGFRATGQVQGVGFRPFVHRLAVELGLGGFVANNARGVWIEAQGQAEVMDAFARRLKAETPPLAEIQDIETEELAPLTDCESFQIRSSDDNELADAQVTVDTATCDQCLQEMTNSTDPRNRLHQE